jgi:predicted alpha/beta hydrolase family esterase
MWLILTFALGLVAVVFFGQKHLIYPTMMTYPRANFHSKYLVTGTKYACLYRPALNESQPTVVFYHGNCENIFSRGESIISSIPEDYGGVCVIEYHGYSVLKSQSGTNWEQIVGSVIAGLECNGINMENVVHIGYSLGTAVALRVVKHFGTHGRGVHLIAPFTSIKEIVCDHLLWPFAKLVSQLVRENIDSLEVAKTLPPSQNVVVYGCLNDEIVPYKQSILIANALKATFHTWNCKHNDFDIPFKEILEIN